jgi:hypothetical protein
MSNIGVFKITSSKNVDFLGIGEYFERVVTADDPEYGEFADGEMSVPMATLFGEVINLMDYTWVSDDAVSETLNDFQTKGYCVNFPLPPTAQRKD